MAEYKLSQTVKNEISTVKYNGDDLNYIKYGSDYVFSKVIGTFKRVLGLLTYDDMNGVRYISSATYSNVDANIPNTPNLTFEHFKEAFNFQITDRNGTTFSDSSGRFRLIRDTTMLAQETSSPKTDFKPKSSVDTVTAIELVRSRYIKNVTISYYKINGSFKRSFDSASAKYFGKINWNHIGQQIALYKYDNSTPYDNTGRIKVDLTLENTTAGTYTYHVFFNPRTIFGTNGKRIKIYAKYPGVNEKLIQDINDYNGALQKYTEINSFKFTSTNLNSVSFELYTKSSEVTEGDNWLVDLFPILVEFKSSSGGGSSGGSGGSGGSGFEIIDHFG